ncbi:MAG: hypothetical protein HOQ35_10315 [Acidobacteriaceae bacterium]|nr:hypothetical protein [Acidobacteriaceae bacterium]
MFRIIVGAFIGYLLSLGSSIVWFFKTHHDPTQRVSTRYLLASIVVGFFCSVATGFLAAVIGGSRRSAWGTAIILFATGGFGVAESVLVSRSGSLELTWVSIVVMVPATVFGGEWAERRLEHVKK